MDKKPSLTALLKKHTVRKQTYNFFQDEVAHTWVLGNKYHSFQIFLPSHKKNNFHEQTKNCSFLFLQNKHFRGEGTTVGWVDWLPPRSTFSTIIQGGLKCPTHNGTRQHFCWQRTPVSFLAFHKHQNKQIEGKRQKFLFAFCQKSLQIVLVQKIIISIVLSEL